MFAAFLPRAMAQQPPEDTVLYFSLDSARAFAREHNYDVINALKSIEIAHKQVNEVRGMGLPQVSATVGYNDFINIPTQLIPAEFFGEQAGTFIPIKLERNTMCLPEPQLRCCFLAANTSLAFRPPALL